MLDSVRADFRRASGVAGDSTIQAIRALAHGYGLQSLLVYRLGQWLTGMRPISMMWGLTLPLWLVYWLFAAYVRYAYDIRLELSAEIGPGLRIHHFGGIRVRNCRIGANCALHNEVLIGPEGEGHPGPVVGDWVWFGPHARIVGDIRVEDGATVAAGAVVTKDVPRRCLVVGNPARVVRFGYDNRALQ